MKYRNGFISNSSSSSFIIGVGKVVNEKELVEYCEKNNIDYEINTTKEILEFNNKWRDIKRVVGDKTFFVKDAFNGAEVQVEINPTLDEKFVSIYHSEDIEENEDGDTDYDVDSSSFDNSGQAVFDIAGKAFVTNWDETYGAGRNG